MNNVEIYVQTIVSFVLYTRFTHDLFASKLWNNLIIKKKNNGTINLDKFMDLYKTEWLSKKKKKIIKIYGAIDILVISQYHFRV